MSTLSPPNPRTNTVTAYIKDIGYCCPYGFFLLYPGPKWTQLIADRLGVSSRAIRYCRNAAKTCEGSTECKRAEILERTAAETDSPETRKD